MKFGNLTNILLLGIICTIYSSFGGIRAIVWTDVFQLIIMMVGFTTIVTIGIIQNGGFIETLHTASKGGRMEFFDMRLNPFLRFSFINSFIFAFSSDLGKYVSDQICCQRLYAGNAYILGK
ncbi:Sodium-coupled monocarboxylate transporter 2 [Armadillidium vulgare]|nr:Sodium-coupled monocarboxylate transporter 2 [Armadillidium vulgare]